MSTTGYRIMDEPTPGTLSRLAVNPLWPFLSLMFAGAWIAWPWFAFNAAALGSATRKREWALLGAAVATSAAVVLAADTLLTMGTLEDGALPYLLIAIYLVKVVFGYAVFLPQDRSLGLFRYLGFSPRNPVIVLIGAALVRGFVTDPFKSVPIVWVVLQ